MDDFDLFLCHASEDKVVFVDPLVAALREAGLRVWYDRTEIALGDDVRARMDDGLRRSRFGVVMLSPRFWKYWTESEVGALLALEAVSRDRRVLPVRCDVTPDDVAARSPLLAGRAAVGWDQGLPAVVEHIVHAIRRGRGDDVPALRRLGARCPMYGVPRPRARVLFGRDDELARLSAKLRQTGTPGPAISLEGLPGTGKTELAVHLAFRLAADGHFAGGIFWFDADDPDLTRTWGGPIADALAVGGGPLRARAEAARRFARSGSPALLVLDNVASWDPGHRPDPLLDGPHVALLVTTRSRALGGRAFEPHAIERLAPESARAFLAATARRDFDATPAIDELLRQLDGHPLALELAGVYLGDHPAVTPADYVRAAGGQPGAIAQALEPCWRSLDAAARRALRITGCFADAEATLALLVACGVDDDALQALRRLHLVAVTDDRWSMHRLVRADARDRGPPDERDRARRAFLDGCEARAGAIDLKRGHLVCRIDGPHLARAVELAGADPEDEARASWLLNRLGAGAHAAGDYAKACGLHERAVALGARSLGDDHPHVVASRSDLALALQQLRDLPRARRLLEHALAAERRYDPRSRGVATLQANLAGVLEDLGELAPACALLEQALAADVRDLGDEHVDVATTRANLAVIVQKLGDLPRARALLERSLAAVRHRHGGDHPSVAARLFNLAMLCEAEGDLGAAEALHADALATNERTLGAAHPVTAYARVHRAWAQLRLGQAGTAHADAARALADVQGQPDGSKLRAEVETVAAWVTARST